MKMVEKITEEQNVHQAWYEEAKKVTVEALPEFVRKLTQDYGHDYGTICHAIAAAAVAAAHAVEHSPVGGITGFQGGAVMWEFIRHWQGIDGPTRLMQYDDMLFPQMEHKFRAISAETWEHLQKKAKENLSGDRAFAHPDVVAHWKSIAKGKVPFGFAVEAA